MTDIRNPLIQSVLPLDRAPAMQPVRRELPTHPPVDRPRESQRAAAAASTSGGLRAAYAQMVVDPETHATVVRIRDANTNAVISESPTAEVQAMTRALKAYAATVARHQVALQVAATR